MKFTIPSKVLAVAGDPGGGAAIAPVLKRIVEEEGFEPHFFAYRQSMDIFRKWKLPFTPLAETTALSDAEHILSAIQPNILATTASSNGIDLEKLFLSQANERGIPSVSVMDFWSSYEQRYSWKGKRILPDCVTVIDEAMKQEMCGVGFPAENLHVCGQPAFEDIAGYRSTFDAVDPEAIRKDYGLDELCVLFISQPPYPDWDSPDFDKWYRGFSKKTVLPGLVAALDGIAREENREITLVIRPHPRERGDDFAWVSGTERVKIKVSEGGEPRHFLRAFPLITGMDSSLLFEASLLGCVVLSYQPELNRQDALPTNRWNLSFPIYKQEELSQGLRMTLFDSKLREERSTRGRNWPVEEFSTDRILNLMKSYLKAQSLNLS